MAATSTVHVRGEMMSCPRRKRRDWIAACQGFDKHRVAGFRRQRWQSRRVQPLVFMCQSKEQCENGAYEAKQGKNVLIVGNGGREHALAWKIRRSPQCSNVIMTPPRGPVMQLGHAIAASSSSSPSMSPLSAEALLNVCRNESIDLVVIGPEVPLVEGAADILRQHSITTSGNMSEKKISVVGPSALAARLEGSKEFMKNMCSRYGIPTASYETFTDASHAKDFIQRRGEAMVVKADGLASGKGVIVGTSVQDTCDAVDSIMSVHSGRIVVEELLVGEEASFFVLVDESGFVLPLASAQDHKRVGERDSGPNTGGMGAFSPAPERVFSKEIEELVMRDIIQPTIEAMKDMECPFSGVLYAGLMVSHTDEGDNVGNSLPSVKLLEYNVRFGDPECQAIMLRLKSDLLPLLLACAENRLQQECAPEWSADSSMVVVMASRGYPREIDSNANGSIIKGLKNVHENLAVVFHAGTEIDDDFDCNNKNDDNDIGEVVARGGRVLGVTARGDSLQKAREKAYEAIDLIDWPEGFCRRDIGWRVLGL